MLSNNITSFLNDCIILPLSIQYPLIVNSIVALQNSVGPMGENKVVPFLKWAGGKRWLLKKHSDVFPDFFDRYIEPFLGSGAVFFHLKPSKSILSDLNDDLISSYEAIKMDWKQVRSHLVRHHKNHNLAYYYKVRASSPRTIFSRAARLIYLNRTCWNGLYRVNLKGEFNVPIGTKTNVLLGSDNFPDTSKLLSKSRLYCSHFRNIIKKGENGDFIFADPPYTVTHNNNNFVKYNEVIFSWDDQVELHQLLHDAASRGAHIIATNANHPSIVKLYKDNFDIIQVHRHSVIAAAPEHRKRCGEIIIRSKT